MDGMTAMVICVGMTCLTIITVVWLIGKEWSKEDDHES